MTDPASMAGRRCAVLLRLATEQDEQGNARQARQLYASALCEARRSGQLDLLTQVRRACVHTGDRPHRRVGIIA